MIEENSLIIRKETIYDKIRKSFFVIFYDKDYQMMQKLEELIKYKRPNINKIVIPKEIGKNIQKY